MLRTCSPDKFTFPLALKACAHLSAVDEGEQIHSMIVKSEFVPTNDVHVSTSLMRMYALCGRIDAAQQLFDKMPNRNVVSWNTLLDGFVKSGDIDSAYEVFDAMPERNVVSWNSIIAGFVKNDLPREALMLFIEMMVCGLVPDEYTMASKKKQPSEIATAADAARAERRAARVTAALNRCDVPGCDTPLHLAARLPRAPTLAATLAVAGADPSLQNAAGWTPLSKAGSRSGAPRVRTLGWESEMSKSFLGGYTYNIFLPEEQ
ncbi:Pentatricopeptide repeat-containing protein, chloroplastic [Ananas comosus]|uniref:Pentatricopeptide repeat-containing protein, chloroplastic n=1 Tax=Ananas comosus TaxID=4615 RepID=A0A199VDI8_ANACO|nr:Pentatricopeptide repeat-containing protein, chloroplastic [Ananas comosus]